MKKDKILVMGDGGWGTAVAILLHSNGYEIHLWGAFPEYIKVLNKKRINEKYLPGVKIPTEIKIISNIQGSYDLVVFAIPTRFLRKVISTNRKFLKINRGIICLTKGIEQGTLMLPMEIVETFFPDIPIAGIYGPSHAEEVARKKPTSVVITSKNKEFCRYARDIFMNELFRVYINDDVRGVQLCAALKNVIAIAAGICDGLNLGTNAKSALLTRALVEFKRFGIVMGAKPSTFVGLAGLGDLLTTCFSEYGRNRKIGELIAKGISLKEILKSFSQEAEGIWTSQAIYELSQKHKIEMPITEKVYKILYEGEPISKAIKDLMLREPKEE